MLVHPFHEFVFSSKSTIHKGVELLNKGNLPFFPVVDSKNRYMGVFDQNSLIKIITQGIPLNLEVELVINQNFPTVFESNISNSSGHHLSPYTIVLNDGFEIAGFINTSGSNDFLSLITTPFFDYFINSISDAVLICDHDSIVKKINKAYTHLTGVSPNGIEGKKVNSVRKGAQISHAVNTGVAMKNIYRQEGDREYFVDLYPVSVGGKILGGVVLAKDITEIQHLTKKVNQWKTQFSKLKSSVASHHKAAKTFDDIIAKSPAMKSCITLGKKVANSDTNILIRGESGTGKDIFSQAIHNYSYRKNHPFVAINCASISPTLILSELFGYEDGAFTGASKGGKIGLFELANKGTLFLDEIGDMDLDLQSKLLRALENGAITRVGGSTTIKVNVRVIAATNVDLEEKIRKNEFRSDLYFRLNIIPIRLPPLRDRKEEIPYLVEALLVGLSASLHKRLIITPETVTSLKHYHWPGNIRELQNVLVFAATMIDEDVITIDCLPKKIKERILDHAVPPQPPHEPRSFITPLRESQSELEKDKISKGLLEYGATVQGKKKVAQLLGISLATLYNKINQYGINKKRFR
ncbi:sigma54 specific transcriptional regulator, Fis family [Alkaliphilus metalliredigens QYMF]|uniref:Sigma54 specific transcriptional regulator, Fis family n=1 Tax=Alkaliphilus metalliredigens (strain QYMF) TaxID=293826 RepID=A6TL57_ALKMQ|nr:sigma 54-interacting transcriptional regulator [Alkaliphilus metalliredigens]ABR46925.1 sigma54 specific transcriptional regulator, Fis family [Alkaliphilus metalliredigens QYMF]